MLTRPLASSLLVTVEEKLSTAGTCTPVRCGSGALRRAFMAEEMAPRNTAWDKMGYHGTVFGVNEKALVF